MALVVIGSETNGRLKESTGADFARDYEEHILHATCGDLLHIVTAPVVWNVNPERLPRAEPLGPVAIAALSD